jgi:3',5'-cyclic AMP phosphodiesterase CpdA
MADTHGFHRELAVPEGDVLIHAGDLTRRGTRPELQAVAAWLRSLPHRHKVVIAGNHDFLFEKEPAAARELFRDVLYLEDTEVTVAGLRVWGSPWQPWFHGWAFNLYRGAPIDEKWKRIPEGLDVLVTHGPPAGYGDRCFNGRQVGCEDLRRHLGRARPRFHLFGHIHEARGTWKLAETTLCNVTTDEGTLPVTVLDV